MKPRFEKLVRLSNKNLSDAIAHLKTDPNFSCDSETMGLGYGDKAFAFGFGHIDGTSYVVRDTDTVWTKAVKAICGIMVQPSFAKKY